MSAAMEGLPRSAPRRVIGFRFRELGLLPVLVLAIIAGTFVNSSFLTRPNLINILQQSSVLAVVVIAETLILLAGKFDLSLESIVGLAPMVAAYLIVTDKSIGGSGVGISGGLGILVCLAVGIAVGCINGFLVVKLGLNAFIATLAMLILLRGTTLGLTDGRTLFGLPASFVYLGSANWFGVPVSVWVAGFLYLLVWFFLRYHRVGRAVYAIGGNSEAARTAGIRTNRILWCLFIAGGALASVAGLMLTGLIQSATTSQGTNLIFTVFAAAVIGGISLDGGKGSLFGALTGVLLLGVLSNILTLSQIATFWIQAAYGGIILIALLVSALGDRSIKRQGKK